MTCSMSSFQKRWLLRSVTALSLTAAGCSIVSSGDNAAVTKAIQTSFGERVKPDAVKPSVVAGLVEVHVQGQVYYFSTDGKYMISGSVLDVQTRDNLTEQTRRELQKVDVASLPVNYAIKRMNGAGTRTLYVFEDPESPYCKEFEKSLSSLKDVTIYTFPYASLGVKSAAAVRNVWCSKNRAEAWSNLLINDKAPEIAAESCTAPIDELVELGHKHHVRITPTMILKSGERIEGLPLAEQLDQALSNVESASHK